MHTEVIFSLETLNEDALPKFHYQKINKIVFELLQRM